MLTYRYAFIGMIMVALAACGPVPITQAPPPVQTITETAAPPTDQPPTATQTAASPTASQVSPTPGGSPQAGTEFVAYIHDGQLLVTDVSNGVKGGTTQYTVQGVSDQINDISWSPSGEFVAFVAAPHGDQHVYYIYALGESTPTDLGLGSQPAWSPDSRSIAYVGGSYPDHNIWLTTIDNPAPRQLSFESNHAWGRPAFTSDGQSLIVSTADRDYVGAQGNTSFKLERLQIDGSGTRLPLPGATQIDGARLPYDLRFSPDAQHLSFSTSFHLSACASPGAYHVSDPDGENSREFISPSLQGSIDASKERYYVGLNYAWFPTSDAMAITGTVADCDFNSPTMGQAIAGPQLSILGLDGKERLAIPGNFYSLSVDRTGGLVAVAHYRDLQDLNPMVELYSAQSGQLVLSVGPGNSPQLQP